MNQWCSPHGRLLPVIGEKTLIMGILNVTPDSFSDGGAYSCIDKALAFTERMLKEGAAIIDVGGESTRPGAQVINVHEEKRRVLPIIHALRRAFPALPLSIDTYKAEVAKAAVEAGADIVNDVTGLLHDLPAAAYQQGYPSSASTKEQLILSPMAQAIADLACPIIITHDARLHHQLQAPSPASKRDKKLTESLFWERISLELTKSIAIAQQAEVDQAQIWIDPGFGFGKSVAENLEILKNFTYLKQLGYPLLMGVSKKSTLGIINAEEGFGPKRAATNQAAHSYILWKGCEMLRVHEVETTVALMTTVQAMIQGLTYSA